MKKILLTVIGALSITASANAGWFIEPEVGYSTGTQLKYTFGGTAYEFNSSSIPVGLRTAWVAGNGFWVGIQGEYYASGAFAGAKGTTLNDTFTRTTAGVEIGFMARGFKVYAGYEALNKLSITPDTGNTNSPTELSGTGIHIGLGYYFKPHFGISLVYSTPTYTTGVKGSTTYSTLGTGNYTDITDSSAALMFTFPFANK